MKKLPVLQSGFIAMSDAPFRLPDPSIPTIRSAVIFSEFKPPLQNFFYSELITELYDNYSANRRLMDDMDFRERLLRAAFEAFGTPMVAKWIMLQQNTDVVTALHMRFLIDTFEFIVTGNERYMQPTSWIDLIEHSESAHTVKVDAASYLKLKNKLNGYREIPSSFVELIATWTRRKNGFEDLLVSLFVIFGRRARQKMQVDVSVVKRP